MDLLFREPLGRHVGLKPDLLYLYFCHNRVHLAPGYPAAEQPRLNSAGELPVQRLKARLKLLASENPRR